jgi:hypothetical protein
LLSLMVWLFAPVGHPLRVCINKNIGKNSEYFGNTYYVGYWNGFEHLNTWSMFGKVLYTLQGPGVWQWKEGSLKLEGTSWCDGHLQIHGIWIWQTDIEDMLPDPWSHHGTP